MKSKYFASGPSPSFFPTIDEVSIICGCEGKTSGFLTESLMLLYLQIEGLKVLIYLSL